MAAESTSRSVERVLDLFEIVLSARTCNLTAAALASELTPTTALRYLRALETRGYLDRNQAGDFSAGPTILRIAASLRSDSMLDHLLTAGQRHLDELTRRTGESTYLAVGDDTTGTYVATAESPRAIRHVGWIGQDVTLDRSALGAAFATPGVVAVRTGAVEPDITAMSCGLGKIGALHVALSIVGPAHRFTPDQLGDHRDALEQAVAALHCNLLVSGEDLNT